MLANKASDNVDLMPNPPPKAGIICPKCRKPTEKIVVETVDPTNLSDLETHESIRKLVKSKEQPSVFNNSELEE